MGSEPTVRFYGKVVDGERKYYRPQQHRALIQSLEGKEFEEKLQAKFEDESDEQHGYYRGGIVRATCMQTELFGGWTEKAIHKHFASLFLKYVQRNELHKKDGTVEVVEDVVIESTGSLGKKRMSEFIDKVLHYLAEQEIYPLTPQEYYYGRYENQVRQEKS